MTLLPTVFGVILQRNITLGDVIRIVSMGMSATNVVIERSVVVTCGEADHSYYTVPHIFTPPFTR